MKESPPPNPLEPASSGNGSLGQEAKKPSRKTLAKEWVGRVLRGKPMSLAVAGLIAAGGLHELNQGQEERALKTEPAQELFSNIPEKDEVNVLEDFQKMLPSQHQQRVFAEHFHNHLPPALLENSNREFLLGLMQNFSYREYEIEVLCDSLEKIHWEKGKDIIIEKLPQTGVASLRERESAIRDIIASFPKDFKPEISFLPCHDPSLLDGLQYREGLKRAASLRFSIEGSGGMEDFLKDTKKQELFGKIADHSIMIEGSTGQVPTRMVEDFVEKNADLLPIFSGSTIGLETIVNLCEKDNEAKDPGRSIRYQKWKTLFSDPKMVQGLLHIKELGITVEDVMSASPEFVRKLLANPDAMQVAADSKKFGGEAVNFFDKGYSSIGIFIDITTPAGIDRFKKLIARMESQAKEMTPRSIFETARDTDPLNERLHSLTEEYPSQSVNMEDLAGDPAFSLVRQLGYDKNTPDCLKNLSYRDQTEWITRTCRNLYQLGLDATQENFKTYYEKGLELRSKPEISNLTLFQGRNVALFAHNEMLNKDSTDVNVGDLKRFGNDLTVRALAAQHPESYRVFRAAQDMHDAEKNKEAFLDFIMKKSKPTVVIDAHGSVSGFSASEVLIKDARNTGKKGDFVSSEELSKTLIERYKNGHTDTVLFVMASCYNQDMIRGVCNDLEQYNKDSSAHVPMPIAVGSTEYGQYGFSDFSNPYRDRFMELLIKPKGGKPATLGDVFKIESDSKNGLRNNISVFVPFGATDIHGGKKNIPFQIAKNEEQTKREEIFAIMHQENLKKNLYADGKTASYYETVQPERAQIIKKNNKENRA